VEKAHAARNKSNRTYLIITQKEST